MNTFNEKHTKDFFKCLKRKDGQEENNDYDNDQNGNTITCL